MLKIVQIQHPSQVEEIFSSFDPRRQSWVVSDLRTKTELQNHLMDRQGYFLDETVLRASDLWSLLLKRAVPHLRKVSREFAKSLLRSFIARNGEQLGISTGSERTIFSYMDQLAPLLLAEDAHERLSKWFEDQNEISERWQTWYLIARAALRWMIHEQKVIVPSWIPSFLQEVDALQELWSQELIVDLGAELSSVEAELLQRLSRHCDIVVLEPHPAWRQEYSYLLKPYEYLRTQASWMQTLKTSKPSTPRSQVLRLSGMLAEVKKVTAQLRQWLEQGISPEQIAVIAPDIESYWPVLAPFLEQEGIPCQKDQTLQLQSLPSLHQWMATLRARTQQITASDLEASYYGLPESSLRYEEFAALFRSLYGDEDLQRDEQIYKLYHSYTDLRKPCRRDEFLAEALKSWTRSESAGDFLILVLREIFQNAAATVELGYQEWLTYLESILASKEIKVIAGRADGVMVTPLMSAQSYRMAFKIFLGLSEDVLKVRQPGHILGSDLNRLSLDLGFFLEHPDHSYKEFQLRWLAEGPGQENLYCFGLADFSGKLLSPSNFWMELLFAQPDHSHETLVNPEPTRWDFLQATEDKSLLALRGREEQESQSLLERLLIDRGMKPLPNLVLEKTPSMSPSQIERYLQCPFVFAAQKVFHLQDHPELDLDEDARSKGTFAHALFEHLTYPELKWDLSDEALGDLLEALKEKKDLALADPRLWNSTKKRYFNLARRFLQFEKKWHEKHSETRIVAVEKEFVFYFDPESGDIHREEKNGTIRFSGKIDRLDGRKGSDELVVIDYKSSHSALKNHPRWLESQELQLLFYMWALEKETLQEVQGSVVGAFYYSFKNFHRGKGFQLEAAAGPLFPSAGSTQLAATAEDKIELLKNFEAVLKTVLENIRQGRITPEPFDQKNCVRCEWRILCRAPHLN